MILNKLFNKMEEHLFSNNTTVESLPSERLGCNADEMKFLRELDHNDLSIVIPQILLDILTENEEKSISCKNDVFYSKKIPSMNVQDYLRRIIKYSKLETTTLILSIIYIDRICERENYVLNLYNIHRFLLAAVLVAIKYNEDDFYRNTQYAKIGGIDLKELNSLEDEFCRLLNFCLFVSNTEFTKYKENLAKLYEADS